MIRAQNRKGQAILNRALCVDDFGNSVYRCWLTNEIVQIGAHRLVGPFNTAVAGAYVCKEDSRDAEKSARSSWDESEANCNTCADLQRLPKTSFKDGFMNGRCKWHPMVFRFHPDDPMHRECWRAR